MRNLVRRCGQRDCPCFLLRADCGLSIGSSPISANEGGLVRHELECRKGPWGPNPAGDSRYLCGWSRWCVSLARRIRRLKFAGARLIVTALLTCFHDGTAICFRMDGPNCTIARNIITISISTGVLLIPLNFLRHIASAGEICLR